MPDDQKQSLWYWGFWQKGRTCPRCQSTRHELSCPRLWLRALSMVVTFAVVFGVLALLRS